MNSESEIPHWLLCCLLSHPAKGKNPPKSSLSPLWSVGCSPPRTPSLFHVLLHDPILAHPVHGLPCSQYYSFGYREHCSCFGYRGNSPFSSHSLHTQAVPILPRPTEHHHVLNAISPTPLPPALSHSQDHKPTPIYSLLQPCPNTYFPRAHTTSLCPSLHFSPCLLSPPTTLHLTPNISNTHSCTLPSGTQHLGSSQNFECQNVPAPMDKGTLEPAAKPTPLHHSIPGFFGGSPSSTPLPIPCPLPRFHFSRIYSPSTSIPALPPHIPNLPHKFKAISPANG